MPPGGLRPPYNENVRCETQAPINNLTAPSSPPIQQTNPALPPSLLPPLPITLAARKREEQQALATVTRSANAEGLKVRMVKRMP